MNIELIFGLALGASTGLLGLGVGVYFGKRYGELRGLEAAKFVKSFQDAGAQQDIAAKQAIMNIGGFQQGTLVSQGNKTLDYHRQQMLKLKIQKQNYEMDQHYQAVQRQLNKELYEDIAKGKLNPVKK